MLHVHRAVSARRLRSGLQIVNEELPFKTDSNLSVRLLLATKRGLVQYHQQRLVRLLSGRFYGLTKHKRRWYAYKFETSFFGRIISFQLEGDAISDVREEIRVLPADIHQIDCCNNRFMITDTRNNRLTCFTLQDTRLFFPKHYYPNGRASLGRKSANYAHINSVFCDGCNIYLVYHNDTNHTGRYSQIAVLDEQLNLLRLIDTKAGCAHNVVPWGNAFAYCDSLAGTVVLGELVTELGFFTRGLALSDQCVIVGGSDFAARAERGHTTGHLFECSSTTGEVKSHIEMPDIGSIYEVRLVDPPDLALSGNFSASRFEMVSPSQKLTN